MPLDIDQDRIEEVAARLDLRAPNREALESLVFELAQHYTVDARPAPFECVIDSATGVGKTFILAASIEYFAAALAIRNFVVIAPGRTIRDKTIANFTPGHPKSLLGPMEARPLVVTSDNFDSPAVRTAIDDDSRTKLYVFTVQSLTAPTTKQGRRTHEFQEGLGAGFYEHLKALNDLMVFADEHHCYYGPAFSAAIRDLEPYAIVGLTATPDAKTPEDQIVYRYPLAAAIADRWVKTPVIVGRRDDRTDAMTKLSDGVSLLRYKQRAAESYCAEHGLPPVLPVMLVVAQSTAEADEYAGILSSPEFDGGAWADTILVVHSNLKGDKKEKALADLAAVEDPESPVRIIISVGMLKEGWDVKNVYVIASMRASVSKVLTEQTLGRGLRLPFGAHTGVDLLDTLEVVAHERYEDLLKRADVLNEQFIDQRTRAVLRRNAAGEMVVATETRTVSAPVIVNPDAASGDLESEPAHVAAAAGAAAVEAVEDRTRELDKQADDLEMREYAPLAGMPTIEVPALKMTSVEAVFSLADITDLEPFGRLGRQLVAAPETELQRVKVGARIIVGRDGLRRTELVTMTALDRLEASQRRLPLEHSREALVDALLSSPVVPARPDQVSAAQPIIDAFMEGLGNEAETLLSAYPYRAAARLVSLVTDEHRKFLPAPHFEHVVELTRLGRVRQSRRKVSNDPTGPFSRSLAYDSWTKGLYEVEWFDSKPERTVASIVDDSDEVRCWVRLQTGELPILWRSDGRQYNADLVVVEADGTHWVVEVKSDRDITSDEVRAKRQAAQRWVNHVNASAKAPGTWRYLLVSETDINQATYSWTALKRLGS